MLPSSRWNPLFSSRAWKWASFSLLSIYFWSSLYTVLLSFPEVRQFSFSWNFPLCPWASFSRLLPLSPFLAFYSIPHLLKISLATVKMCKKRWDLHFTFVNCPNYWFRVVPFSLASLAQGFGSSAFCVGESFICSSSSLFMVLIPIECGSSPLLPFKPPEIKPSSSLTVSLFTSTFLTGETKGNLFI